LVALEPVIGSETGKTRPCLVVSPEEMNVVAPTLIVAPLTTKLGSYPTRVDARVGGQSNQVMTEQIRVVSRDRILSRLEVADSDLTNRVLDRLQELFAP